MLLTAELGLHGAGSGAATLADQVLPAQVALKETSSAQSEGEVAFTLAAGATDPATRAAEVTALEESGGVQPRRGHRVACLPQPCPRPAR
jgi:hypothetical protein